LKVTANLSFFQKIFLGLLLGSFVFIATFFPRSFGSKSGSQPLKIYFFNIGQGDSAFILAPSGQSILIDGGPDAGVLEQLDLINSYWDREIDYMILTHPHADHLAGLIGVLKAYNVKNVLWNNVSFDSPFMSSWIGQLDSFEGSVSAFERGDELNLGGVSLRAIWPPKEMLFENNINNTSIVNHLKYKDFDAVFTGDLEGEVQGLIDWPGNVELLKVPHQGAKGDTSEGLIKALRPYVAVISVGENSYGHPGQTTLDLLDKYGVDTYRTDKHGTIEVITDGEGWWVTPEFD